MTGDFQLFGSKFETAVPLQSLLFVPALHTLRVKMILNECTQGSISSQAVVQTMLESFIQKCQCSDTSLSLLISPLLVFLYICRLCNFIC